MASIIKTDNIQKVSDDSNIIKKCGSTTTVGSGAGNTITVDGATVTLGRCGGTVSLASGATQTGFGRTGTVDWCSTAKTSPFTAVSGDGYFVNTTSGAVTVTLPASPSAGDIVSLKDYANTFQTNNLTVGRNSSKIGGECADAVLNTEGQSITLVYIDGTRGWLNVNTDVTIDGNYDVEYLVLAGGGGGGKDYGAGGGAGGFRTISSKTFSVSKGTAFPITVGSGGTGITASQSDDAQPTALGKGSDSVFSTITSTGGGAGGAGGGDNVGSPGGSGGGGRGSGKAGGTGNTPPVSPPQGNPGADGVALTSFYVGQGGGGAGAAASGTDNGAIGSPYGSLGPLAPSFGEPGPNPGRYFGGGGGAGAGLHPPGAAFGGGGIGGGGNGKANPAQPCGPSTWAGLTNMGGGGGGGNNSPSDNGANGGSGIVVIRHLTSDGGSGGNSTGTCGSDTIRVFTADGTFTA